MATSAQAQGEYSNWYFGEQASLHFEPDQAPQTSLTSAMTTPSACATLSDAAGNLLFYSDGKQVWNREHQVMAGGQALGGNSQFGQGCAVVRVQGAAKAMAYVLTQRFTQQLGSWHAIPVAAEIMLDGAGGLGEVTRTDLPIVADTVLQRLGESRFTPYQALVRHANGRDCWLITRLHEQGVFLATLLDGSGQWPCPRTVVSRLFPARTAGSTIVFGTLVAAPDGRSLLYNDVASSVLLEFDPATGRIHTPVLLKYPPLTIPSTFGVNGAYALGAAFSSNGSRLYLNRVYEPNVNFSSQAVQVVQYDLTAGTSAAIAASGVEVYNVANRNGVNRMPWFSQRGPDGLIYFAMPGGSALDAILSPNARGRACRYTPRYQFLGERQSTEALPLQPNDVNLGPLLHVEADLGCAGQALTLRARANGASGGTSPDSLRWLLGNGSSPVLTLLPADTLRTTYAAGTYTVRVERRRAGLVIATTTATIRISPAPVVRLALAPDTTGCAPLSLRLSVGPQPVGSLFKWQNGSPEGSLLVTAPGSYWVDVTSPAGCTTRAQVQVRDRACAITMPEIPPPAVPTPGLAFLIPTIITPNGDKLNDAFAPQGLPGPARWSLSVFDRWGREVHKQEAYDNTWAAVGRPDGVYYYMLINTATGQRYKGWVEVLR